MTGPLPLLRPMLAVSAQPFDHPDFYFEVKWDGYRCLAYLGESGTSLVSRNQKDITAYFPDLAGLHRRVRGKPALLDGEITVLREGRPSFAALQSRARLTGGDRVARAAQSAPALYMAFDILYHGGAPLLELPLTARMATLEQAVNPDREILISEGVRERGTAFFRACVEKGLEGVVGKHLDGRYLPGTRSPLWKKIRATREADLVICGYRQGKGGRVLGSLVLGAWDGEEFIYQGMVGTGLTRAEELTLLEKLATLENAKAPWKETNPGGAGVKWVAPVMVCRVQYLTTTGRGLLRHPVYLGLREDKAPQSCGPVLRQG
ncbi:MAG: non-homologous end-joining DNA ligase [Firmicutes bacterium]|nr:non-homologous end-joining DNA ligase [Bacillota bacterium]